MVSPTRREFMGYSGGAAMGAAGLGVPTLESELAAMGSEEIDRSTPMIFLRLDGVEGESRAKGHEGEIEVFSCRWSLDQPAQARRGGSQRHHEPHRGHVTVLKAIDKATPLLYQKGLEGIEIPRGRLSLHRSSGGGEHKEYYTHTMENAKIASLESGQHGATSFERCVFDARWDPGEYSP